MGPMDSVCKLSRLSPNMGSMVANRKPVIYFKIVNLLSQVGIILLFRFLELLIKCLFF